MPAARKDANRALILACIACTWACVGGFDMIWVRSATASAIFTVPRWLVEAFVFFTASARVHFLEFPDAVSISISPVAAGLVSGVRSDILATAIFANLPYALEVLRSLRVVIL